MGRSNAAALTAALAVALAATGLATSCGRDARDGPLFGPVAVDTTGWNPLGLLLTWQRDPSTTLTIDWHMPRGASTVLEYRASGGDDWERVTPVSFTFPLSSRRVHRVELTGLRPDSYYEFRFGEASRSYLFRTMPATLSRPVRFITSGDTRHNTAMMERTARQAVRYDPDFIVFGGDLAYASDAPARWQDWFDVVLRELVTPAGRVIPVLVAIGNHEVVGGYYHQLDDYQPTAAYRTSVAPFFYTLFAMPGQPGYAVIDFGSYMSVVLLDSDHTNPVAGEQTRWLEDVLSARQDVPHVFPVYHVPAYPSYRQFEALISRRVREHWAPLFEEYGVRVAFENHEHTYKRTYPLRDGEARSDGIVYLGDGAWGVGVRELRRDSDGNLPWYIQRGESVRHFIVGEIDGGTQRFVMVDEYGDVFDEYPAGSWAAIAPRVASAAAVAGN